MSGDSIPWLSGATSSGGCILFREWGRIGQAGTVRLTHYPDQPSAERALEKIVRTKIRRGYRPVGERGTSGANRGSTRKILVAAILEGAGA